MSGPAESPTPLGSEMTLAVVVHGLFIGSLLAFPPAALVGLIMAHIAIGSSGPVASTHYRFQVRTFWLGLAAWAIAGVALFWGAVLSVILVGVPLLVVAITAFGAIWLWALVRSAIGLAWALRGEPCPRPDSLVF